MKTTRRQERSSARSTAASFDRLENRRHMAVDLTASTLSPVGAYGDGDSFDVDIKLRNSGNSDANLPVFVNVFLSKDTKLGNSDDIVFAGAVFSGAKKNKTFTMDDQVNVQSSWAAGDYYVITNTDPFNVQPESNDNNNTTISKTKEIRIVTSTLKDGEVVKGTSKNDVITVQGNFANEIVTVNGVSKRYRVAGNLKPLTIDGAGGNDKITCDKNVNGRTLLWGGSGNDTIIGGSFNDSIDGGSGNDRLYGGDGNDSINGSSGNDWIDGGVGVDRITGGSGKDTAKRHTGDVFASIESTFK